MKKTICTTLVASAVLFMSGCGEITPKPNHAVWETLQYKPKLEACSDIDKKYLKSYSFMQTLEELGNREGINFTFTTDSDDIFIEGVSFRTWSDALYWLDQQKEYKTKIYGYASKNVIKTIQLKKFAPSFFELMAESKVKKTENGYISSAIGKVKIDDDISSTFIDFIDQYDFSQKYLTLERFLNDFYYYNMDKTGQSAYFDFDKKSKSIIIRATPKPINLTPYKMRIFSNFLDVNGVSYIDSKKHNQIAIEDNFMLWKKSYLYLNTLKKFKNNVYGIKTDQGYYEIADSRYPALPIAIELITWTPYGEREYNVYYNNKSYKVITKDRNFVFFTEDTHKKFIVRTY